MINPRNVVDILANLIAERLTLSSLPANTNNDEDVATMLFENVESVLNSTSYSLENEDTLDFDSDIDSISEETTPDDTEDDDYNDEYEKENIIQYPFSLQYMKDVVQFYDEENEETGKRKHSFRNVQRRFKRVRDKNYIRRFRKYIEAQGTKKHKLDGIDSFVYQSFENARNQFLSIHDIDLKSWGLRKAAQLSDKTFAATDYWIYQFKKRHNIVSRKITKLVTKREIQNKDVIHQSAKDFVSNVHNVISNFHPHYILNTDQSGLQLEMYSARTLSYREEKLTLSTVRSINNTTHSYTVQPMISMSGKLVGPLFLCLKEESGYLGERVKRTLFEPNNIVLTCSKSGKLTNSLVRYWRDNVLKLFVGNNKCLLISDCWGAQGANDIYDELVNVTRLEIPKKTTSMIQPLDVYFNRQYKVIARKLYDYVRLHDLDINLAQRNNIIKMNSLIHNQLSSNLFNPMIRHAWFQSGYLKNNPGVFRNVKEICFTLENNSCSVKKCGEATFICCSWCQQSLCINHFFIDYHIH